VRSQVSKLWSNERKRVSPEYWRGLCSSLNFPGRSLVKCLEIIHKDIVRIWNFNDENLVCIRLCSTQSSSRALALQYLEAPEFGVEMSRLVEDLADNDNLQRNMKAMV
jgi:hypothetical protein